MNEAPVFHNPRVYNVWDNTPPITGVVIPLNITDEENDRMTVTLQSGYFQFDAYNFVGTPMYPNDTAFFALNPQTLVIYPRVKMDYTRGPTKVRCCC